VRREDRQVSPGRAREILVEADHGVLSLCTNDVPYGVPLNFCVLGDNLYVHCALEGRKLDMLAQNPRVSFCVVGEARILREEFSTAYESAIVEGVAEVVDGEEKQAGLVGLIQKYSPEFYDEGLEYIRSLTHETKVVVVRIASITGKSRK